ncbi:MAG: Flp pilus assembly protein CpaB [Jatrophihabitans sp.]|uniref:Flp pilus assembly protein CpaB n=1 Tax=Jatrophihabitans sp. TaxID=1932789 RepID=UPI0039159412
MLRSVRRMLPRFGRTPRLCAAGLCLILALASTMGAHAQRAAAPAPRWVSVVVSTSDLPAGHRIAGADLRVARWPPSLRPAGARAAPGALIGRRLAGPVTAGEAVTSTRLLGNGLTTGLARGAVAAAVPLDDPRAADLVRPGDHLDLLETPRPGDSDTAPTGPPKVATVASHALVLAVLPRTAEADAEVVLAVDRAAAVQIARDRAGQVFAVVADPP